jgi:folate-binding protein YgfZ
MTGQDRRRLLHALTTQNIQELAAGQSVYCFFLNAQGRVLADAVVAARAEDLLVDVEAGTRQAMAQHIDRYIIADDAAIEDITAATFELALEGPCAAGILATLGVPVPQDEHGVVESGELTVARMSATGEAGYRLLGPGEYKSEWQAKLAAVATEASVSDVEAVRLEHGKPRYGVDITERNIAHETGLLDALSFTKGCYLGQEIVERVRARGMVHRQLAALRIASERVPAAGEKIVSGEKELGEITSAAWSARQGAVRALAYLRLEARRTALHTSAGEPAEFV